MGLTFRGTDVIEYDAELPPVARLGGGSTSPLKERQRVVLECEARGLQDEEALRKQYIHELQELLQQKGFKPMSDDLKELQTQKQLVQLLTAWVEQDDKENQAQTELLDPKTLQQAQLQLKQLQGRVDEGYAFGRRFFSVESYVNTLDSSELLQLAQERGMTLPKLDANERAMVKAVDRELVTEAGPLRSLTLRQLATEAEKRGLIADKRDSKGKKSKRGWVDMLRPVIRAEVRAEKIRDKEEDLLREKLIQEMEKDAEREQHQRMATLIDQMLQRSKRAPAEPENDPTLSQDNQDDSTKPEPTDKARKYLEALAKSLCAPSEAADDIVMRE